jgi:Fe2+ transport system protein FeoA
VLITIPFDSVRAKLVARGLHEGDEITCEGMDDGHVLVTMGDGRRLVIERQNAVMIEVELCAAAPLPSTVWYSQYAIAR